MFNLSSITEQWPTDQINYIQPSILNSSHNRDIDNRLTDWLTDGQKNKKIYLLCFSLGAISMYPPGVNKSENWWLNISSGRLQVIRRVIIEVSTQSLDRSFPPVRLSNYYLVWYGVVSSLCYAYSVDKFYLFLPLLEI